ncbi:MAG TPA: hypothetical protein VE990_19900 [Acidimicrobiales bacterium]|nr:hypothetical protein [Acidimicrobiales bacterium]
MRKVRAGIALATTASLTGLFVTAAGAATSPAPTGVGTASSTAQIVGLNLGTSNPAATTAPVLAASLLGDAGLATIDPNISTPASYVQLGGLISKSGVSALNLSVPSQPVKAAAPGGPASAGTPQISLSNVAGVTVPSAVATGTILPAALTAGAAKTGSHATLSAGISNVGLAGGLVNAQSATSTLSNDATPSYSDSIRSVQVGQVTVLSLGQLLQGLGIPLVDLPVSVLNQLLGQLGIALPAIPGSSGLPSGANLTSVTTALSGAINQIAVTVTGAAAPAARSHLTVPVPGGSGVSTSGLPGSGGTVTVPSPSGLPTGSSTLPGLTTAGTDNLTSTVTAALQTNLVPDLSALGLPATLPTTLTGLLGLLTNLQGDLSGLLTSTLSSLDNISLLGVSGAQVSIVTKAADKVSDSTATLTANLGSVIVGPAKTPALDLTSPVTTVNKIVGGINAGVSSILNTVSSSLANVVNVSVLSQAAGNGVSTAGHYVKAQEGVTLLTATVTPPANLSSLVSSLTSAVNLPSTVSGLLTTAGVNSTQLGAISSALAPIAGLTQMAQVSLGALAQGAVLKVGTITSASDFTPTPASAPTASGTGTSGPAPASSPSLPRTGGDYGLGGLGALLAAAALAVRRAVRRR